MIEVLILFRDAFLGSLIIAGGCSILGVFVVYRRVVFVAAALAQLSSAGVALAGFLAALGLGLGLGQEASELALSLLATLGGVLFFASEGGARRVPADARLGIAFVVAGAVAILLVAGTAGGDAQGLLLQGNILGITGEEIRLLASVIFAVVAVHLLLHKELVFVSFDPEMAATLGYRPTRWSILLYALLGLMITVSIQSAGVLLVFSFLVLPPVTGTLLGRSVLSVTAWSAVSGLLASVLGFMASVQLDLPTGPTIVGASGVGLGLVWIVTGIRDARSVRLQGAQ